MRQPKGGFLSTVFQLCESRSHRIKLCDVGSCTQLYRTHHRAFAFYFFMSRQILSHHHITHNATR